MGFPLSVVGPSQAYDSDVSAPHDVDKLVKAAADVACRHVPDFPSALLDLGDSAGEVKPGNFGEIDAMLDQIDIRFASSHS